MFVEEVNPDNVTSADIIVSIPSYNEADNIAYPTTKASEGLAQFFGDKKGRSSSTVTTTPRTGPGMFFWTRPPKCRRSIYPPLPESRARATISGICFAR